MKYELTKNTKDYCGNTDVYGNDKVYDGADTSDGTQEPYWDEMKRKLREEAEIDISEEIKKAEDRSFPNVGFIKDEEVTWGKERDNVNHPSHYNESGIECIEAIRATLGAEGFEAYCKGNCMKYLWRYEYKNGLEDLKKAQVYLNWMVESMEDRDD